MTTPHQTLQNGFPGPRLSAVAFILAPLLLCVGGVLLMEFEGGEFEEIQQRIAASPGRAALGVNVFIAGWLLAMICVFALARLIAQRRPVLAAFGGVLAVFGLVVSLSFSGIATFENAIAQYPDRAVAAEVNALVEPAPILFALLPGIPLGWILLAVGAWRANVLGPARAVLVAGPALMPIGAIGGVAFLLPVAFAALAVALVPLGIQILLAGSAPGAPERAASPE